MSGLWEGREEEFKRPIRESLASPQAVALRKAQLAEIEARRTERGGAMSVIDGLRGEIPEGTQGAHYDANRRLIREIEYDADGRFDRPVTLAGGEFIAMLLPSGKHRVLMRAP